MLAAACAQCELLTWTLCDLEGWMLENACRAQQSKPRKAVAHHIACVQDSGDRGQLEGASVIRGEITVALLDVLPE